MKMMIASILILFAVMIWDNHLHKKWIREAVLEERRNTYVNAAVQANALIKNRRQEFASGEIKGFKACEFGLGVEYHD